MQLFNISEKAEELKRSLGKISHYLKPISGLSSSVLLQYLHNFGENAI